MDQAIKVLKGKPGESVKIGVLHQGGNKIEQMSITRAIIHVSTVLGDSYKSDDTWNFFLDPEKKIAYIRLTSFSRDTTKELRAAMDEISQQGLKGLILDLRFNPGGLLTAATEISDMFLEEGKIVSTKGRNTPEKTWNAKKADTYSGFPMAILVNRYSASASEIVSAALQDHQRAAIVGERTWGKGSVQNVIELESGRSLLKLTTASYHRPSGKNIHRFPGAAESEEWGVMPDKDFDVKFSGDEMEKYLEHRRKKDVLTKEPVKSDFVDSQLAKALAFVEAKLKEAPAEEEKKAADKDPKKPEDKAAALR
jgi:carboxyl-terminal processing protease